MAELLAYTRLDNEQERFVGHIRSSADSLLRAINDILDFSKLEAGRMTIEALPCSPRTIVEDITGFFLHKTFEKKLTLHCHIDDELAARIEADPDRLRQILINLVGNAIKFTARGGIRIRAEIAADQGDTVQLRVEVEDDGIGIAPDTQERIFEPFEQADGSTTRRFGGTGLGLSISKRLVRLMGGEIGIGEHAGPGRTFWFTVRLRKAEAYPEDAAANGPSGQEAELTLRAHHRGRRILFVEDDVVNQEVGMEMLREVLGLDGSGSNRGSRRRTVRVAGRPVATRQAPDVQWLDDGERTPFW